MAAQTINQSVELFLFFPDRMPDYRLQPVRCCFPCVAQINLMVHAPISDIKRVSLFIHEAMHQINRRGFIIISAQMHG